MRVIVEAAHIAVGIAAAVVIGLLASWAYPRASWDIWIVAVAMALAVVIMGVRPLRAAWRADHAANPEAGGNG